MTNNIKNFFVMSLLIFSASYLVQNNAFATTTTHPNLGANSVGSEIKNWTYGLTTMQPHIGKASDFAVLGASTVTNTGNTIITGNLGVSPGTAITGFPPGSVMGATYAGVPIAASAHTDASAAYRSLSSAMCTTREPTVTDMGGQTLKPGVYCFPSSVAITGTLTLSGNGVYIFKIGSTLTTAAGNSHVVLTNGATAANVFWAVGSSATLGTGSDFKGTVIAYSSITSTTGATVYGRLIAINGAVTLDTNKITIATAYSGKN
ncbi:MAG: ice-binding family protein [Nitrosotalea sp.]